MSVVVVTRNRASDLGRTLERLDDAGEAAAVIVVDNGSTDETRAVVAARRGVELVALPHDRGSSARTLGVERARTPYVAFCDDDSWWSPGALGRAAGVLDAYPRLGALAARVLVGPDEHEDGVCRLMARSPARAARPVPGPRVLGFIACGSVVRRSAYLEVGGFHARFGIGGEEELLAIDLAMAGWDVAYVPEVVAHHHPSEQRDHDRRRRRQVRNALWVQWLRRPWPVAVARSVQLVRPALADATLRRGLVDAVRGLPWVARDRRRVPPELERNLRLLERQPG